MLSWTTGRDVPGALLGARPFLATPNRCMFGRQLYVIETGRTTGHRADAVEDSHARCMSEMFRLHAGGLHVVCRAHRRIRRASNWHARKARLKAWLYLAGREISELGVVQRFRFDL